MKSCGSCCFSASSPGGCRAVTSAGSNPSDTSLWPTLPGSGSSWTAQAIPASPVSTDRKWRETLEVSRDCSAREPEGTKENRQETYNASCCSGKVYLGPSRKPSLPQGQASPSTSPTGGPGPHYSQTSAPGAKVLATEIMNALKQGRRRKLPQLWGLLTCKLNRAAGAQRY